MLYLFGSSLVKKHFEDFREPVDIDYISNNKEDVKPREEGIDYFYNPITPDRELTIDEFYTLRIAHMVYNCIWDKTYQDVLFLKNKGCKIDKELLVKFREYMTMEANGIDGKRIVRPYATEEQMKIVKELENE